MGQKIVVGPLTKGLRNDVLSFNIDNESFPTLINTYQWRGRVKRKRGTSPLCRLQRFFNSAKLSYGSISSFNLVAGAGNLFIGFNIDAPQFHPGNIVPGSVQFTDSTASNIYTDANEDGTLQGNPAGSGTINYATGAITIASGSTDTISIATFNYYTDLPVMDLEDLNLNASQFPKTLSFDTKYSYQIVNAFPYFAYDVSFYKNSAVNSVTMPGYVPKTNPTPIYWNGQNYQQFWSTNYENSLWATNGITIPFTTTNIGMQFKLITNISGVTPGPPAIATFTIGANHGLVIGDFVFINELIISGGTAVTGLNLQTGYVTAIAATTVTVEFPNATLVGAGGAQPQGIMQYLTSNLANPALDSLRWYDGDPTSGNEFNPTLIQGLGWVNFCPPIYDNPPDDIIIGDLTSAVYYLVGARLIIPFKGRLFFLGVVVQCSGSVPGTIAGTYYVQDTIVFSQAATPYYTCSFTGSEVSATTTFFPLLTPPNQGASANAYFTDLTGYGGYVSAGLPIPITTVIPNQDVLLVGFTTKKTKVLYTGNDIVPFQFYIINSELGDTATFSGITMDRGGIAVGDKGFTITDQQSSSRIDLEIPDQVFQFDLLNNGTERITAQRDFVEEWIYFSYPSNTEENVTNPFPDQTLFYNYRDASWAIFNESYTTYGPFRRRTGFTWQTVGSIFSSWNAWNQPWNASSSSLLEPEVIAGNQQGFVVVRGDEGTSEAPSLYISAISGITITSPNHNLSTGDFVFFLNALGMSNFNSYPIETATITGATNANPCVITANNTFDVGDLVTITGVVGMTQLNNNIYTITAETATTFTISADSTLFGAYISGGMATTPPKYIIWQITSLTANTFSIASDPNKPPITPTGTYMGNGTITRLYRPQIQTKQFPTAWEMARKTRIGVQQYLLSNTVNAQITLQIYLSQNSATQFNNPPYVPNINANNNSIIYSNVLYTCQESTNLGLTPANVNLQQIVPAQGQTWHRMNTSLIGDTVQLGFTLSDAQMFDRTLTNQVSEIELHGMILDVSPSQLLS